MKNQHHLLLEKIENQVLNNLSDENFGVTELSKEVGMSRSGLHRKIKMLKGKSVSQFIREIRLRKAMELLKYDDGSISEIAYRVGFSSNTYFNRCFVGFYGYPPREVRRRLKTANQHPAYKIDFVLQKLIKLSGQMLYKISRPLFSIFIILAFISFLLLWKNSFESPDNYQAIAVLPIENLSGNLQQQHLAYKLHEMLVTELCRKEELQVVSNISISNNNMRELTMREMANQLKIGYIVEGAMIIANDIVRLNLKIVSLFPNESHIFAETYFYNLQDFTNFDRSMIVEIAMDINNKVSAETGEGSKHIHAKSKS